VYFSGAAAFAAPRPVGIYPVCPAAQHAAEGKALSVAFPTDREQANPLAVTDERAVRKVILDENIHYIHMVFQKGDGLPEHLSNSTVYMTVVRGRLSIGLDDQPVRAHAAGTVLKIPVHTKMNVRNLDEGVLELIVVKAPAPRAS
jgi:quercetin dioxygenase-like cupin family protein